ncbi:MAG: hypothetical protein FJ144_24330 [Deltaproteobacteria bacterium]|nr:hypothetical protein [Deltaproteobacteria bacterium]
MARVFKREKNGPWWIDFNDGEGRRRRINTKAKSKQVAIEILADKLAKVAKREHLGVIDDTAMSFADYADEWLRRVSPTLRPRTRDHWTAIVERNLKPAFPVALRSINLARVEDYVAKRLARGVTRQARDGDRELEARRLRDLSPAALNRDLSVLRHMTRRAVDWKLLATNPLEGLKLLKEPKGRVRFLSAQEIESLLSSFPRECDVSPLVRAYLKPLVLLAINSGARLSEILGLRRRDIDWERCMAHVEGKGGDDRVVRLNEAPSTRSAPFPLACISHQIPTAAADSTESSRASPSGLLDVLFKYACVALRSEARESSALSTASRRDLVRNAG